MWAASVAAARFGGVGLAESVEAGLGRGFEPVASVGGRSEKGSGSAARWKRPR